MSKSERRAVGDMKQGLTSARPKLSILPRAGQVHGTRVLEYGGDKYARGNYHGPPPAQVTPVERVMGYVDAALRHLTAVADAYNRALGTGGDTASAIALPDNEASGNFPASGLPHLAHALASIMLGVTCGVDDGLLPADPGQPWKANAELAAARVREAGVYDVITREDDRATAARLDERFGAPTDVLQAPTDPHAELRAEIAAAGLPPAPAEAMEGRKLVHGRVGAWTDGSGRGRADIWSTTALGGQWRAHWDGTAPELYLVPKDWT